MTATEMMIGHVPHGALADCWKQLTAFAVNEGDMLDRCADSHSVAITGAVLRAIGDAWCRSELTNIAPPRVDMDPDGIISLAWDGDCYFAFACYSDKYVWYSVRDLQDGNGQRPRYDHVPFVNGSPKSGADQALFAVIEENCPKFKEAC